MFAHGGDPAKGKECARQWMLTEALIYGEHSMF